MGVPTLDLVVLDNQLPREATDWKKGGTRQRICLRLNTQGDLEGRDILADGYAKVFHLEDTAHVHLADDLLADGNLLGPLSGVPDLFQDKVWLECALKAATEEVTQPFHLLGRTREPGTDSAFKRDVR